MTRPGICTNMLSLNTCQVSASDLSFLDKHSVEAWKFSGDAVCLKINGEYSVDLEVARRPLIEEDFSPEFRGVIKYASENGYTGLAIGPKEIVFPDFYCFRT